MKSTRKTTSAVLRSITEESDAHWADKLGKSVHTIRHVEAGTLKLSAALAEKMNYESGISIGWLLDGDTDAPPVAQDGRDYTKQIYDEVRARKKYFAHVGEDKIKINALELFRVICAILVNANRKRNFHMAAYRTWKAINELRAEFGEANDVNSYEGVLAYVGEALALPVSAYMQDVPNLPALPLAATSAFHRNLWEGLRRFAQAQAIQDNPTTSKPKSKQPSKKRPRR